MNEYAVAIIPSSSVAHRAIAVSRRLQSRGGLFVLDAINERPHVSLYHVVLPAGSLRAVREELLEVVRRTNPFKLQAQGFRCSDGWVQVEYRRSRAVIALQRNVIRAINPIRSGMLREKDRARLSTVDSRTSRNIARFGYRFVGGLFHPHLTFTRLANADKRVTVSASSALFSFPVTSISIFTLGMHGTCVRLLQSFDLRG